MGDPTGRLHRDAGQLRPVAVTRAEDASRRPWEAIVAQTGGMQGILRELLQCAKPWPPGPGWVDRAAVLGEVAASLSELAAQRRVRIEAALQPERLPVYADAGQLRCGQQPGAVGRRRAPAA